MKSHAKVFFSIYYVTCMTIKDLKYAKTNNVNLLYFILSFSNLLFDWIL